MRFAVGVIFWSLLGLFYASQIYMNAPEGQGWTEALKTAMPRWYIWGALTPGMIWADRLLSRTVSKLTQRVLFHIPTCIGWLFIFVALNTLVIGILQGSLPEISFSFIANQFYWNLLIYWLIMGVYWTTNYYTELKEQELKSARLERNLTEARLQALQDRIHPHFLFNALNTISAYMENDPKTARRMIANLGELLRFSLEHTDTPKITLSRELSFLDSYLEIEQMRFKDHLSISKSIDPDALEVQVPSFLIQPLVENAIRHGINPRNAAGHVYIEIQRQNGRLHLQVKDDGVGLPDGWKSSAHSGVGLTNTRERLNEMYGTEHHFSIRNRSESSGVQVKIELPVT
ncbi:MAG: histidine kinase [Balneolaceae bacterium]|nr:histidine kinase [Balneolaceae bacterium]